MRPNRGVSLLEVLTALTLTAMVCGVLFAGRVDAARRFVEGRRLQLARSLAWRVIAELEAPPIRPGDFSGGFGDAIPGYTYQARIEPARRELAAGRGLYHLRLNIDWLENGERGTLPVETLIVEVPKQDAP